MDGAASVGGEAPAPPAAGAGLRAGEAGPVRAHRRAARLPCPARRSVGSHFRRAEVVIGGLLKQPGHSQQHGLTAGPADQLHTHRETL